MKFIRTLSLQFTLACAFVSLSAPAHGSSLFLLAYSNEVLVFDDAKGQMEARIQLTTGLPTSLRLSMDKKTFYVTTNDHDGIEVIDVATRKVTNHFVLDTPTTKYRLNGVTPDPTGKFLYCVTTEINKLTDHYEVGMPRYTLIDVAAHKIVKTFEIEKEDQDSNSGFFGRNAFEISTDGKYLYQFRDKVAILDAATMKVVDRIDLAKPDDPFMRNLGFGGQIDTLLRAGLHISLFVAEDAFVHNKVFGIARFDLNTRGVDFTPIGPADEGMVDDLQVAPDMKNAWTVVRRGLPSNKRCEFWHFDLTTNKVTDKSELPCRTNEYDNKFIVSRNGKKLYTYGNGWEIEVYDLTTLKHERTWDLNADVVGGPLFMID
jgi:DNA-binding beta-propeller fold protein YncE